MSASIILTGLPADPGKTQLLTLSAQPLSSLALAFFFIQPSRLILSNLKAQGGQFHVINVWVQAFCSPLTIGYSVDLLIICR